MPGKKCLIIFAFAWIYLLLLPNALFADAVYKVHLDHNGTTTDFTTIQQAVDASVDGDTILIDAGTYREQVTITKNITMQGAGIDQTIIESPDSGNLNQSGSDWKNLKNQDIFAIVGIKTASAGTVTVKNLTVDGRDQGYLCNAPRCQDTIF